MAVKSCKVATKNVSDMGKELSRISQVSSVGALADQMAEAEQSKTEVETQLQERVCLLFNSRHFLSLPHRHLLYAAQSVDLQRWMVIHSIHLTASYSRR